jgi:hypothetical protein
MKDRLARLGVMCGQHVSLTDIVGFLDQDYHYKSVATQIPHDVGLGPNWPAGI